MVAIRRSAPLPKSQPAGDAGRRLIRHWRVFAPGKWNGEDWTRAEVEELAENYRQFIKPINSPDPYWVPWVSINHNDGTAGLANGRVVDCGVDPDGWFWVTFTLSELVANALDKGELPYASIEWWNTRLPSHQKTSGFPKKRNGKPFGVILRAVTLCGARPPAVRGQPRPPLSEPIRDAWLQRFDDSVSPSRATVEIPNVDELIQKLMEADPSLTPEQCQKIAFVAGDHFAAQQPEPDGGEVAAVPADADPAPDADPSMPPDASMTGEPAASVTAPAPDGMAMDCSKPNDMVQKFADLSKDFAGLQAEIAELKQARATEKAESVTSIVQKFSSDLLASKAVAPAEADRIVAELNKLSTPELREANVMAQRRIYRLDELAKNTPADRKFSEAADPTVGNGLTEGALFLLQSTMPGRAVIHSKTAANRN